MLLALKLISRLTAKELRLKLIYEVLNSVNFQILKIRILTIKSDLNQ